jgi:hypothetical protein
LVHYIRGRHGRDRMIVGFTTPVFSNTYAISVYHHLSCEFERHSWRGVHNTTLCDKVCQWLATGQWISPDVPVSSTNKNDHHDITEILLKVVLNTLNHYNTVWPTSSNLVLFYSIWLVWPTSSNLVLFYSIWLVWPTSSNLFLFCSICLTSAAFTRLCCCSPPTLSVFSICSISDCCEKKTCIINYLLFKIIHKCTWRFW